MMRNIILISLLMVQSIMLQAQSMEELRTINKRSKDQFIKPESIDQLSIDLRPYENSPESSQDTLILDTYRNMSSAYASNNHFKQAYDVYRKYLDRKENILFTDKSTAIANSVGSVSERRQNDDNKQIEFQNTLRKLQNENATLESKRLTFKGNFSLGLIILSSLFAIILVGAGIRMLSLRSRIRQNQDKMKKLHRLAVLGNFEPGIRSSVKVSYSNIGEMNKELLNDLKKNESNFEPAKKGVQIVAGIEKILNELKSNI